MGAYKMDDLCIRGILLHYVYDVEFLVTGLGHHIVRVDRRIDSEVLRSTVHDIVRQSFTLDNIDDYNYL